MMYAVIAEQSERWPVARLCQVLGVPRSGYYAWRQQKPGVRARENQTLTDQIQTAYQTSRCTYGSPRIHVVLQRQGVRCGRHRIARLMRQNGLVARAKRKKRPQTTQRAAGVVPAPNHLNQEFTATAPNQKWVCDFTCIATQEGWLYLAVVLDLFSRQVIGWAMRATMETELVLAALQMALTERQPPAGLLHHSDQGSQYTSAAYCLCLAAATTQLSMSRVGNCYDNAVAESFFSTLKTELGTDQFATRQLARTTLFEFMEVWYNRQRLHSTLGYLSPVDFEAKFSF